MTWSGLGEGRGLAGPEGALRQKRLSVALRRKVLKHHSVDQHQGRYSSRAGSEVLGYSPAKFGERLQQRYPQTQRVRRVQPGPGQGRDACFRRLQLSPTVSETGKI